MTTETTPAQSPLAATLYPEGGAPAPAPAAPEPAAAPAPAPTPDPAAPAAPGEPAAPAAAPPAGDPPKPEGETPPAEPAPEPAAARKPEDYADLAFPENFKPDDAQLGKFRELAAKANLDPALAKDLSGLYVEALTAAQATQLAAIQQEQTNWRNEVMTFPEFAADQRERTQTLVSRVVEEFGTPDLRTFLDQSGAGNNPQLVRFILNLSNALMEGEPTPGGAPTRDPGKRPGPRTLGQVLYPDSQQ